MDAPQTLYDSGPVPLFARLLTLPFLVLVPIVVVVQAGDWLSGRAGAEAIATLFSCGVMTVLFLGIWRWRNQVFVEGADVVIAHRGFFRTSRERFPLSKVTALEARAVTSRRRQYWDLHLLLNDGGRHFVTRLFEKHDPPPTERVNPLAERLRAELRWER